MAMYLKIGHLYYWQHRVVVEYIGISKEGKNMFKTTNYYRNVSQKKEINIE